MPYAAEFLIARLSEQAQLAPKLEQGSKPGGTVAELIDKLKEGVNLAPHIAVLRSVQSGARKYAAHFSNALAKIEPLVQLFAEIEAVKFARYETGEDRQKALETLKGKGEQIAAACKAAVADIEKALALIEEGERAEMPKEAVPAGAKK